MCKIIIEKTARKAERKQKTQDHYNKHLKRCVRGQNNGTLNEKSQCSPAKEKVKEVENRNKETNKEFENHKERKATTTTTKTRKVLIGDSMVKNVQSRRMRRSLIQGDKFFLKSFSGATTDDMSFYAIPPSRTKPNKMIIHTGVNDLINENNNKTVAQDIIALAESIKIEEIQVSISGLIHTADKKKNGRIDSINKIITDACLKRHLGFIDNGNIDQHQQNHKGRLLEKTSRIY